MEHYYLAPMEGVTGYIYRNAVRDFFGTGVDKYFTPFFSPHTRRTMTSREINDIIPEHNERIRLIPQILTINADDFIRFEEDARAYGYDELNLNFGCPSGTVVSKGRGSGFLIRKKEMTDFLDEVFFRTKCRVSVKTRLGMYDPDEFYELLDIYNRYPMEELIIHLRVREEQYSGQVHREMWDYAREHSKNRIVYNGDVTADPASLPDEDGCSAVMTGRGMIADPSTIRQLRGGRHFTPDEIKEFVLRLERDYAAEMPGEVQLLHKLKELWSYMQLSFPGREREFKKLFKAATLGEYKAARLNVMREE